MSTDTDFANTRAALARFDRYHQRWTREFERMLASCPSCAPSSEQAKKNNDAVHTAFENCGKYRVRVMAPAFYKDGPNSLQTCEMVFRYDHTSGCTTVPNWIRDLAYGKAVA